MRKCLAIVAIIGLAGLVQADGDKPAVSLKVGDPAPILKADKWLQGTEVKEFDKDKIYVIEFWATWCGPCIAIMPHVADLQAEYGKKGVTFIGYSARDEGDKPSNNLETVSAFVKKRGPKLGYTFAYSDDRTTYDAWMKAAGQGGIPCSYVVDKGGKIAYIGHPMYLDFVLPKVVSGTWTDEDVKKLDEINKDVNDTFAAISKPDAEAGLKALTELEKKYPPMAQVPYFISPKLNLLVKAKQYDEAKSVAEKVIAKAKEREDPSALSAVSGALRSPDAKDNKDLAGLALKAAEEGLKVAGDDDFRALLNMAETQFALGDKAKAKEFGAKAIAAASSPDLRKAIENIVKKYDE